MKSVTTSRFRKAFEKLPKRTQIKARDNYRLWQENPNHPSLNFKQIHSSQPIHSVRVGIGYRALGVKQDQTMVWFWIGSHEEYNTIIDSL